MATKYHKDVIAAAVERSLTWKEVCLQIGRHPTTSAQRHFRERAKIFNIDSSHFTANHRVWNKGKTFPAKLPIEAYFAMECVNTHMLKKRLIKEKIKEDKCECCGLSEWLGEKLSVQLHHNDGNRKNNTLENLRLLCPNCHSQTSNYAGRKNKKIRPPTDRHTPRPNQRKVERPTTEVLQEEIKNTSFVQLGKKYSVSDNAVRKWCKAYQLL